MPDYVRDLLDDDEENKKKKKADDSIVSRLKKALGAKDYKEELPHKDEDTSRPWDSITQKPKKATPSTTSATNTKQDEDEIIKHLADIEAEKERKKKEEIARRVGGWSRSNE